ncbi:hypothetical protein [Candidatus Entotheonella palauensis]|uniref:FecR protein domain-containing protein n=1 Tax=Candidatus Entotheonella gemina TaxID=1429439 RepID=W4MER6_9BACT|nr:hypothetical protein [Candidatus Entotheonella palauensis]ETX08411.1 MAG: hypothetical protein ETSY2_05575 [Candidatus Entotheonella gemina]
MQTPDRIGIVAVALALWILTASAAHSAGAGRVGTVLLAEGVAEVKSQNAVAWKPLHFRDTVFINDTVRTEARSRLKLLLRDDSIWTLDERGRMAFTEIEKPRCKPRRTTAPPRPGPHLIVQLLLGKLRGVTSLVFGSEAVAETRTPNAVMCMYGTSFIMIFTPPGTSEFIGLDGLITVQNLSQATPEIEPVPPNFRTRVVRRAAPVTAVAATSAEVESLTLGLVVIEQAPEPDVVVVPDTDVPPVAEPPEDSPPDIDPLPPIVTIPPDMMIPNSILQFIFEFPR